MSNKRVTNECIQRELGQISAQLKSLRHDLEEVKEIAPRIRSLEAFRSYIKGISVVVIGLGATVATVIKQSFQF